MGFYFMSTISISKNISKTSLRLYYRELRRLIPSTEKIISSQALRKIFIQHFDVSQKNIAVYLAQDGELDLKYLIEKLWENKANIYLPVIDCVTQQLQFAHYSSATIMKKNQYKIDEPADIRSFIAPEKLDIVLMPLVAFDKNGTRLGMGKGFYDKAFEFCRASQHKPKLIGVAYSCQYCDKLPVEIWDVPLDGILTEKELLLFDRS